jgi:LmbE family N-acetylglucosaminyl deacetylase
MSSILNSSVVRVVRRFGTSRLLRRIHRITHRLPVTLREVEKASVLVVAPHMDDEVIGPGGTLALHQRVGSRVSVCFAAAGATPEADATRKAEAEAVARYMAFDDVRFFDYPEGRVSRHEVQLGADIGQMIREVWPDQIFCPFPADHHRDHTATAMALALGIREARWRGDVWCYEVWSPLWPNVAVDISDVVDTKKTAIEMHASQMEGLHYVDGALGLNRYRSLRVYVPYAEAFFVARAPTYLRVAAEMNRL